ncbi:unnamed protein product, partial [Amoebophrya sp. A120]
TTPGGGSSSGAAAKWPRSGAAGTSSFTIPLVVDHSISSTCSPMSSSTSLGEQNKEDHRTEVLRSKIPSKIVFSAAAKRQAFQQQKNKTNG